MNGYSIHGSDNLGSLGPCDCLKLNVERTHRWLASSYSFACSALSIFWIKVKAGLNKGKDYWTYVVIDEEDGKQQEQSGSAKSSTKKSEENEEECRIVKKKKVDSAYIWRGKKTKEFLEHKEKAWKLGICDAILRRRRERERERHLNANDKEKTSRKI